MTDRKNITICVRVMPDWKFSASEVFPWVPLKIMLLKNLASMSVGLSSKRIKQTFCRAIRLSEHDLRSLDGQLVRG